MHLQARHRLTVRWAEGERVFAAGARIHTENSYNWTLVALPIAGNPPFLKPSDAPEFPQRRIELDGARHPQIGAGALAGLDQAERAFARGAQCAGQRICIRRAGGHRHKIRHARRLS